MRAVLAVAPFRKLWVAFSLSSLGDWLSVLALTSFASLVTADAGYQAQTFAVGGVLILKMLPTLLLGPFAGAIADRFDRRRMMVAGDLIRGGLFISIPLVGELRWVFIATFLSECVALFWMPAKEATIPNIVPRERLESANQLNLFATYGSAPVAAGVFAVLSALSDALSTSVPFFGENPVGLALYINAATFLVAAATVFMLRELPWRVGRGEQQAQQLSVLGAVIAGWNFVRRTRLVRGLIIGVLGAFAAGGAVIGVARVYVDALGGGNAAYGVLFGAVFLGMAFGMFLGPRILADFSRRRLFGMAIVAAGLALALVAIIQNLIIVVLMTCGLGAFAGVAWVIGYTLIGLEVEDGMRGRTFAFMQSLVKIDLLLVLAVVPFVAGAIGTHAVSLGGGTEVRLDGTNVVLLLAALLACAVGLTAYHQMDDRRGISLWRDLTASARGEPYRPLQEKAPGVFIAFEGGEGSGKTTQVRALAVWLRDQGFEVVTTREPGATRAGMRLRAIVLDQSHEDLSPRAEALIYAADRAEHVDNVIRPALKRGAVVLTDRFVDSTLAYQGAGRRLPMDEMARLNRYATGGLVPDLTVLLDLPAEVGLERFGSPADRMESEPADFHERVSREFRALAERDPQRYLVVDATLPVEDVARRVQERLRPLLPDPVPQGAEEHTHTMPAVRNSSS